MLIIEKLADLALVKNCISLVITVRDRKLIIQQNISSNENSKLYTLNRMYILLSKALIQP